MPWRSPVGGAARLDVLGIVILCAALALALALGVSTGCRKDQSPGSGGAVSSGGEGGTAFTIQVPQDKASVEVIAQGSPKANLRVILDKAYDKDGTATGTVVRNWLQDRDVLKAEDLRDLLDVTWNKDKEGTASVIRPWFMSKSTMELSDIPLLLTKAWEYNADDTRNVLRTWGGEYGFIDASDVDALKKYELVRATDFSQVKTALEAHHKEKYGELLALMQGMRPAEELNETIVEISWASARSIPRGNLRFSVADGELVKFVNTTATIAPANRFNDGIPVTLEYAVDIPKGRVQVQDADFIAVVAKWKGIEQAPERNSHEWKQLLRLGVVNGSLYLRQM